jgi:hypothetical protein
VEEVSQEDVRNSTSTNSSSNNNGGSRFRFILTSLKYVLNLSYRVYLRIIRLRINKTTRP